jgi:MOSC domain-containing protein YiiM
MSFSYIDDVLLQEAEHIARNDGELVNKFQNGEIKLEEVAKLVSYATHKVLTRRTFDSLFYEAQVQALVERLKSCPAFQENWGANEKNERVAVKSHG